MPDAPESTGTAQTVSEAYEAAHQSLGISDETESAEVGTGEQAEPQPAAPAPDAGTVAEPKTAEPEHIAWAKKIDGDYDPATGQFVVDHVIKRAYELNKLEQRNAR